MSVSRAVLHNNTACLSLSVSLLIYPLPDGAAPGATQKNVTVTGAGKRGIAYAEPSQLTALERAFNLRKTSS